MPDMAALTFHSHGGPDVLRYERIPRPEPGPGEALLRVRAVALNHLDLFVREGWPGLKLAMPHVGGSDVAGEVAALGEGVSGWRAGDRVVLYPDVSCGACEACRAGEVPLCREHRLIGEHVRGGMAEHVSVPAANLKRIPDGFPYEDAAAASLVFLTAWRMLVTRAAVRPGERVLVVGSGGGVNTAAIQIARLAGARVIALAGGPRKGARAKALGAEDVIDYRERPEWHREVLQRTGGRGVDVVVDNVGASTWTKSLKALAHGGRLVTVGGTTGYDPPAGINYVFWKGLSILGSTMGTRREFDTVLDLVFEGKLRAVVDRTLPLSEGRTGHDLLEKGEVFGKVVLTPG